MKKLLSLIICLCLFGCQSSGSKQGTWPGVYTKDKTTIEIYDLEEEDDGQLFLFTVQVGERDMEGYAFIDPSDDHLALYELEEDGHRLTFTLDGDQIIIEENGGPTYLGVDLSGTYSR